MTIHELVRRRFPSPAYATLFEVRDQAGFSAKRSADALAMGLWRSRGLHLHGLEIKRTRQDWLRELKDPAKAEAGLGRCDFIWLVTAGDIVRDGELPETWGLLVARGSRLETRVEAKLRPPTLDKSARETLATMLRRAMEFEKRCVSRDSLEDEINERVAVKLATERAEHGNLLARVRRFQEASGIDINRHDPGRIGEAARVLLQCGPLAQRQMLERVHASAEALLRQTGDALKELIQGSPACAECGHGLQDHALGQHGFGRQCNARDCACTGYRMGKPPEPKCQSCGGELYGCDAGMGCKEA